MAPIDGLEVLAAGLARRARLDALHAAGRSSVALVIPPPAKPAGADLTRQQAQRRAVPPSMVPIARECTAGRQRIISRGTDGEYSTDGDSRLEKPVFLDWSIISAWK